MRIRAPQAQKRQKHGLVFILGAAALGAVSMFSPISALAEQPAEEEAAVVVGEDESVVSDEGDPQTSEGWTARKITPRPVGDKLAYIRQSSEAFDDPDQRLSLELKYYFDAPQSEGAGKFPELPLAREAQGLPRSQLTAAESSGVSPDVSFPIPLDAADAQRHFDIEWLDSEAGPKSKVVAAILPTDDPQTVRLVVARAARNEAALQIEQQLASREIASQELLANCVPGGLLDTFDRPKSLGSKGMFLGRVIAVLKQVNDRYAVDLYGESLNAESDCRVWLWNKSSSQGQPVNVRFVQVPIKKGPETVSDVTVLAVTCRKDDGSQHTIAVDYPLCRPAMMAQMQKMLQQKPAGGGSAPAPDLEKLVGAELLDEFARRLVNGTYR